MGYEPDAFARRFHQREDILDALEEGILAIDGDQTIIFLNTSAAEMLSLDRGEVLGRPSTRPIPTPLWTGSSAPDNRSTTSA